MCLHRNSRHSNQASSGQQHALITTFFCYNHVKESFLFFFFMNFLSKFCDTIFFYHANPLTVILSSKCCMMFLVMVFSGDIITLFSMFTNPQRKSFLATTEPSGEHLKSSAAQLLLLFCWCRWHQRISSADIWSFRHMFSALSLTFPLTDVWHLLP